MNMNHHTPFPAPRPFCALVTPRLALLVLDKLDADEAAAARAHLAECDYCQWRLREYEILRGALHRHFGVAPSVEQAQPATAVSDTTRERAVRRTAPPLLTLEDIMHAANQEDRSTATNQQPRRLPEPSPRKRRLTALGALAAALIVAVLAASLFASRNQGPAAKPTPSSDPVTKAYVSVLQQYYQAWYRAEVPEYNQCSAPFEANAENPAQLQPLLAPCRPVEVAAITAAQTLLDHLATTPPPARWQAADSELKGALKVNVGFHTAKLRAIDAQSGSQYLAIDRNVGIPMGGLFCDPIQQFNAGPPPLDPRLPSVETFGIQC